ncbi:MAG: sigma 54-interacting transcriptional regulator [Deferrisomatales bacterium]|nr:sigma 54-interacting transcriptional regulator [Deferrisomatales bacterium]
MTVRGLPPLTELLSAFSEPAALLIGAGGISWANPAFRALFAPDPAPASLEEWERRSPPGPSPLWEELRRQKTAVRPLASSGGVALYRCSLVPAAGGDAVLVCSPAAGHVGLVELRERTALLEAIFRSLNEGVLALDNQERIMAFSLSAERMTGFSEAEVVGRVCAEVFQAAPGVECPFRVAVTRGQGFQQREMTVHGKGGRPIHVAANASLLRDPDGTVSGAVVVLRDLTELERLRAELRGPAGAHGIVGNHPSLRRVIEKLETVAPSEVSLLILGESGTGKELAARAVHELSPRRDGPFVKVNCAALADSLLESELFGHARGAFTGAVRDRPGRFEAAHAGTLFLDEIGETSPALQVRLLRLLQEGEFERVGESRPRKADVRIVAATNRDLRREVAEGRFREDLFFHLCVVPIHMPPLRQRPEDVPLLVDHFLKRLALREGRRKIVSPAVYRVLQSYAWPGNVRELENALAHAYVCTAGDLITPESLPDHILRDEAPFGDGGGEAAAERREVIGALEVSGWNKGEAARKLGLSRTTLWRRMRDLGIRSPRRGRSP